MRRRPWRSLEVVQDLHPEEALTRKPCIARKSIRSEANKLKIGTPTVVEMTVFWQW